MSRRREYEIAFVGLKPGEHEYNYEITDKFFDPVQPQDFNDCKVKIKLKLDKKSNFMLLKFDVDGSVVVSCDRCGNPLPLQLWDEFKVVVKVVEDPGLMNLEEDDPDVHYIGKNESHLYLEDWIYEFINLAIPMQKMCNENEIGGPLCNKEVLDKLKKMEEDVKNDPKAIWKGLEQFKNLQ